jgi:UDP-glucose 4-epimerase
MTEIMLRDAITAYELRHVILRYFNVAGADPLGRAGTARASDRCSMTSRIGQRRRGDRRT